MTHPKQAPVKRFDSGALLFRLDDQMRVMPVSISGIYDYLSCLPDYHWTYQTKLADGTLVSSTFLGVGLPSLFCSEVLYFETMVFDPSGQPCHTKRYPAIEECIEGHHATLEELDTGGRPLDL